MGRFMAEDPLGLGGGQTNVYGFGWNSPTNYRDPNGTDGVSYSATAAQIIPALPLVAYITCKFAQGFTKIGLALDGYSNTIDVGPCFAIAAPSAKPAPAPAQSVAPTSQASQCTPQEEGQYVSIYKRLCNQQRSCSGSQSALELSSNLAKNLACYHARANAQDICYGGRYPNGYETQQNEITAAIQKCGRFIAAKAGVSP